MKHNYNWQTKWEQLDKNKDGREILLDALKPYMTPEEEKKYTRMLKRIKNKEKLLWTKQFIDFNIKEGIYDAEQFRGWTDKQLIEFVHHEELRADWMMESAKENL